MATATTLPRSDWRQEWFENEDATYLNLAGQSPMPKVAVRAVQAAIEWKKFPQRIPDSAFFDVPNRIRTSIAKLIGAQPDRYRADLRRKHRNVCGGLWPELARRRRNPYRDPRIPSAIRHLEADGRARRHQAEHCFAARSLPHC